MAGHTHQDLTQDGPVVVKEEGVAALAAYADIPIRFEVRARVEVVAASGPDGGWVLREVAVERPWQKDYDAYEGEGPSSWARRFDVSSWGVLAAYEEGQRVGGAVVAWRSPGVQMLEGRDDLAVLWDLRVHPAHRRKGIGRLLVEQACAWARARGCTEIRVETQDVNVPACRLYERAGFRLLHVRPGAYPALPGEVQLIWQRRTGA